MAKYHKQFDKIEKSNKKSAKTDENLSKKLKK